MMNSHKEGITVWVHPAHIELLNKIMEGYDNLAIVTAIDPSQGRMLIRVTDGMRREAEKIIRHLPFPVKICDDGWDDQTEQEK